MLRSAIFTLLLIAAVRANVDVRDRYIVVLKSEQAKPRVADFLTQFNLLQALDAADNGFDHSYDTALVGFAGKLTPEFKTALEQEHAADIKYIVPDGVAHTTEKQDGVKAWGLTRTSQRKRSLPGPYYYPTAAGEGVDVYVIDTGIIPTHTEFGGRASMAANFVTNEANLDLNGHGTHCSGTIGSASFGIAKKVSIKGVKVLNAQGSGTWSAVIQGVDFVAKNVRKGKTVASMSLGGGKNQALNDAMNNAVKAGVVSIVASGNETMDACTRSPAGAELVFAVGATDDADKKASFSNFGKCVKIYAPGVNVLSLWTGANNAVNTISGTSMATPHAAGVAALLMSQKQYNSPQEVYAALTALATKDAITGLPAETVNLLLYNGAGMA